ncbi:MAG: lipoyl protein ligase domain-containing protein [Candidatus Hodarchaeales archaeon]
MSNKEWRFLPIMTQSAPVGVALDEALLDSKQEGCPNTLRLYHFNPPAVICGYHQSIEDEVDITKVHESGFDLTRRITGGGTLFVAPDQIGIVLVLERRMVPKKPDQAIQWFSDGIIKGLSRLGINAVFRPKNDIAVNHKKLVGTGQAVRGQAVLFHAIVLLDLDMGTMLKVLKIPDIKFKGKKTSKESPLGWCFHSKMSLESRFTTINKEMGGKVDPKMVYQALRAGFEENFGVSFIDADLLPREKDLHEKYIARYQSDDWVFLRKAGDSHIKTYTNKTKGGLVRVKVALDKDIIKSLIITGDFFIFPSEAIFDLEAALKWSSAKPAAIRENVKKFFVDKGVVIPWLEPEELAEIIIKAIES